MRQDDHQAQPQSVTGVLLRRVYEGRDGEPMVFCERKCTQTPVVTCRGCQHNTGLRIEARGSRVFLECTFPEEPAPHDPAADLEPQAAQPTLASIMTSPIATVHIHTPLAEVARTLLDRGVGTVVVEDEDGQHVGIVSRTDLLKGYTDADASPGPQELSRAADAMTPVLLALPTEATIARAAALMAYEGVHHLLVTTPEGKSVGMVSSLDIMTWLARREGFVVPGTGR